MSVTCRTSMLLLKRYAHPVGVNRDDGTWAGRSASVVSDDEGVVEATITAAQGRIGTRLRIASADEIVNRREPIWNKLDMSVLVATDGLVGSPDSSS